MWQSVNCKYAFLKFLQILIQEIRRYSEFSIDLQFGTTDVRISAELWTVDKHKLALYCIVLIIPVRCTQVFTVILKELPGRF